MRQPGASVNWSGHAPASDRCAEGAVSRKAEAQGEGHRAGAVAISGGEQPLSSRSLASKELGE